MSAGDSTTDDAHSVTRMIQRLKEQDAQAASAIWQRYFERLVPLARARLRGLPHRAVDEEDILVSVFDRFFQAARENRFASLEDRDDLWQILFLLTERKVADEYRAAATQKRGGANAAPVGSEQLRTVLHEVTAQDPGPEFVATLNETLARALKRLSEANTREVAILRMEGYANGEIAARLEISLSSVERKLRVIRAVWMEEFQMQ